MFGNFCTEILIKVNQVQVLRKRHNAAETCHKDFDRDSDIRWREMIMKLVGCVPTYWKALTHSMKFNQLNLPACSTSEQYGIIFDYYFMYPANATYEPSCTDITITNNIHEHPKFYSDYLLT